jgi:hypothetical protein
MKAQHSPAPWGVAYRAYSAKIVDADGKAVAMVTPRRDWWNADLIAAAPELLEALEWAVETADAEQYEASWYASARAAIAKAKGEIK